MSTLRLLPPARVMSTLRLLPKARVMSTSLRRAASNRNDPASSTLERRSHALRRFLLADALSPVRRRRADALNGKVVRLFRNML
jgi:hypothetical protein